ncbi:tetratricopeptide repeat protein [Microbaculum marinum]|uniref:Tetratricopeptide repeat protein n=1 Tax=Microbaculum marinum TaxID=1764581 RepID=A0AAW9S0S2_9HYPH
MRKSAADHASDIDVSHLHRRAVALRREGRHRDALALLEPAIEDIPDDVRLLIEAGENHKALGDPGRSAVLFRHVLELEEHHRAARIGLIDSLIAQSSHVEALGAAKAAGELFPQDPVFGLRCAHVLRVLGKSEEAVGRLRQMLERFPASTPVKLQLAAALREAGMLTDSRAQYGSLLAVEPENKAAWLGLIDTAVAAQDFPAALDLVKQARADLDGDFDLDLKTGFVLQKNDLYREAVEHFQAIVRRQPNLVAAQLALAMACLSANDHALYSEAAARLAELAPRDFAIRQRLAALASALGNWEVGAEHSAAVLESVPDHVEACLVLARCKLGMNRVAEAEALVRNLLDRSPLAPAVETRACMTMSQVQHTKGDPEAAVGALLQARRADPTNLVVTMELITRYSAASKDREIGPLLDDAIETARKSPNPRLATVLAEYGRSEDALSLCLDWQKQFPQLGWLPVIVGWLSTLSDTDRTPEHSPATTLAPSLPVRRERQFKSILEAIWEPASDPARFVKALPPSSDPSVYAVAWSHCTVPGLGYAEWKRRVDHATRVHMDYEEVLLNDTSELLAFEDFLNDDGLEDLAPLVDQNRPCFIVSSHLGAPATPWFLTSRIPQFHCLRSWGAPETMAGRDPFRGLTAGLSTVATVRAVRKLLASGGMLGAAPDAPFVAFNTQFASGYSYGTLCGQEFRISNLIPRLARRMSVPTFWVQAVWQDRRLVLQIEEIEVAAPKHAEALWMSEWTAAYLSRLEKVITGVPENLNLRRAAVWRYLHARTTQVPKNKS